MAVPGPSLPAAVGIWQNHTGKGHLWGGERVLKLFSESTPLNCFRRHFRVCSVEGLGPRDQISVTEKLTSSQLKHKNCGNASIRPLEEKGVNSNWGVCEVDLQNPE